MFCPDADGTDEAVNAGQGHLQEHWGAGDDGYRGCQGAQHLGHHQ